MAWVHKMISKDPETMTGECAACGPVALKWRHSPGGKVLCCATARAIDRKNTARFARLPHGLRRCDADQLKSESVCAVCGSDQDLVVDHCHQENRLREVLCGHCNKGLGFFRDDPALLRAAADYVERHRNPESGDTQPDFEVQ